MAERQDLSPDPGLTPRFGCDIFEARGKRLVRGADPRLALL